MAIANICTNKAIVYRPVRCRRLVNRFVYTPQCQIRAALIALLSVYAFLSKLVTHTHPFNGPLSETTRVSRYQKGKTNLDFTGARDSVWQWYQLGMCKSAARSRQNLPRQHLTTQFFTGRMPFLPPNQHGQSTEGTF